MEDARDDARVHLLNVMRQVYGWQEHPRETGEDGQERDDLQELGRQIQETGAAFDQFSLQWRVSRRKEGRKLPKIYEKDKATGRVRVLYDELETQFREYLDWKDHPEKHAARQPSQAEQQREQLAGWQEAMRAELPPREKLSRMNAENEKKRAETAEKKDGIEHP